MIDDASKHLRFRRRSVALLLVLLVIAGAGGSRARAADSVLERLGDEPTTAGATAEVSVEIVDADSPAAKLPARVTITASDGKHPDGSGRGVYADGRFFVDGRFTVPVAPGSTTVKVACGPHVVPLEQKVDVPAGRRVKLRAKMSRWFDPAALGWYSGDNHVHTQHDATAVVKAGAEYTRLQARANGLSFVTEADTEVSAETAAKLDAADFLYRTAPEVRPGPFVGHINTPGVSHGIFGEAYEQLVRRPLPRQGLHDKVRELGGVMIHTHPLTPPFQLHWMGAGEFWSDAVAGRCADLFDLDSPATQLLWFAGLNLGNRVACSSYTDCALGRANTPSPGDRRVYCKAGKLDYTLIVDAMRKGRTVATNAGPILVDATLAGGAIGDTVTVKSGEPLPVRIECNSLLPMGSIGVFCGGRRVKAFNVNGKTGRIVLEDKVDRATDEPSDWYVVRAENAKGDWAVTSPIYVRHDDPPAQPPAIRASAVLLEVSNHARFVTLTKSFFAHLILTVRPPEGLAEVRFCKDGKPLRSFKPADGDQWHEKRVPVTGMSGDYGPGWAWHGEAGATYHFQSDWPVTESGWYHAEATTTAGRVVRGEAVQFDADLPVSHAISSAKLDGPGTKLALRGWGEAQALDDIRPLPGGGDAGGGDWWYPKNSYWRLQSDLNGTQQEFKGGGNAEAARRFREVKDTRE